MKNITLKIDDETYRQARVRAADAGTSVSAMVREFLQEGNATASNEADRRAKLEQLFLARSKKPRRAETMTPLSRDEIYAARLS